MELLAVAGLAAAGYLVASKTEKGGSAKKEGFASSKAGSLAQGFVPSAQSEGFVSGAQAASGKKYDSLTPGELTRIGEDISRQTANGEQSPGAVNGRRVGASAVKFSPELDLMYKSVGGQSYPSEPRPGLQGTPLGYAREMPPTAPYGLPDPSPLEAQKPMVEMRSDGIETQPNYNKKPFVLSPLTGEKIPSSEFRHNNMVPFYGGSIKQNMTASANQNRLDSYTGSGVTQIRKKEVETMFNTANTPYGSPYGLQVGNDFVKDRIVASRNRAGEKPFEPTRVAPGVGEKGGALGNGGFQQFEVDEIMKRALPTTDKLRTADNPKLSYDKPVVPGQHFIGKAMDNPGEVRHYRPDRFYIDEGGDHWSATPAGLVKEAVRSTQVVRHTDRSETTTELFGGPANSQDFGESYVSGAYRTPMTSQFGGAGYRNANMTEYYTPYVDSPEADYGKKGYENKPNERSATSERVMGLNLAPADTGLGMVHYEDDARPTRRGETIGTLRQNGVATAYANTEAPAITVWDRTNVARTTVKETTIDLNHFGQATPSSAPARLKVYDPMDVARPTQKAQLSRRSYTGPAAATVAREFESRDAAYNMWQSGEREATIVRPKPIAGNGGIAVFTGEQNGVTFRKLDADIINDRAMAVNRVQGITPGAADMGQPRLRVPLKLDQSRERFGPEMVTAVENNPLNQSLRQNAMLDEQALRA